MSGLIPTDLSDPERIDAFEFARQLREITSSAVALQKKRRKIEEENRLESQIKIMVTKMRKDAAEGYDTCIFKRPTWFVGDRDHFLQWANYLPIFENVQVDADDDDDDSISISW